MTTPGKDSALNLKRHLVRNESEIKTPLSRSVKTMFRRWFRKPIRSQQFQEKGCAHIKTECLRYLHPPIALHALAVAVAVDGSKAGVVVGAAVAVAAVEAVQQRSRIHARCR